MTSDEDKYLLALVFYLITGWIEEDNFKRVLIGGINLEHLFDYKLIPIDDSFSHSISILLQIKIFPTCVNYTSIIGARLFINVFRVG